MVVVVEVWWRVLRAGEVSSVGEGTGAVARRASHSSFEGVFRRAGVSRLERGGGGEKQRGVEGILGHHETLS